MRELEKRIVRLEARAPAVQQGRPFLWPQGVPLADALDLANLTLDDGPFLAIRLVGLKVGERVPAIDPVFERDRHLIDA